MIDRFVSDEMDFDSGCCRSFFSFAIAPQTFLRGSHLGRRQDAPTIGRTLCIGVRSAHSRSRLLINETCGCQVLVVKNVAGSTHGSGRIDLGEQPENGSQADAIAAKASSFIELLV